MTSFIKTRQGLLAVAKLIDEGYSFEQAIEKIVEVK